ncbi:hypothetical protein F511_07711 [Dorcoceras hygrometricum]|uniref:Uncharacterized protein n=1 Tax=Dorcoceras hygrometricum TaxID=472368 RepID=A0A2Z7CK27_9LAMI|nr:hypothetical protein F511_07711 [Dorcoceras hygrometricum]
MAVVHFTLIAIPIKKTTKNSFFQVRHLRISALSTPRSSSSTSDFQDKPAQSQFPKPQTQDSIKLAFAKAEAPEDSINPNPTISELDAVNDGVDKEVPLAVKLALEKAREYKKSKGAVKSQGNSSEDVDKKPLVESNGKDQRDDGLKSDEVKGVPLAVKLALERANEYKKNKGGLGSNSEGTGGSEALDSGLKGGSAGDSRLTENSKKKGELSISSIDFMGLGFADKKTGRSLPAGLVPISDPFPEGDIPEVEILIGDKSKFDDGVALSKPVPHIEDDDIYKPKVSTWGVFPRPRDISKTYGGGRTLRAGEALESKEERAAKEARTRQLLAAYKSKTGLNIDPEIKAICEKALKDGDSLMDLGKLKEALPFYSQVMEKLPFQSKLHGLAALQWSICQDSLSRSNEARVMYEKLQSHPNPDVSKKARQLVFSFQAMEMMKVGSSNVSPLSSGYQDYFEAFVKDKKSYTFQEAGMDEQFSQKTSCHHFGRSRVRVVETACVWRVIDAFETPTAIDNRLEDVESVSDGIPPMLKSDRMRERTWTFIEGLGGSDERLTRVRGAGALLVPKITLRLVVILDENISAIPGDYNA